MSPAHSQFCLTDADCVIFSDILHFPSWRLQYCGTESAYGCSWLQTELSHFISSSDWALCRCNHSAKSMRHKLQAGRRKEGAGRYTAGEEEMACRDDRCAENIAMRAESGLASTSRGWSLRSGCYLQHLNMIRRKTKPGSLSIISSHILIWTFFSSLKWR